MCIRHLAASKRCLICAPQSLSVSRQHYHSLFPNWETETERFNDMPQITWSAGKWQSLDSHTGLLTPRGHPPPPCPPPAPMHKPVAAAELGMEDEPRRGGLGTDRHLGKVALCGARTHLSQPLHGPARGPGGPGSWRALRAGRPHLYPGLGQVRAQSQLLPGIHVGVVGFLKDFLQLLQLECAEGRAVTALLALVLDQLHGIRESRGQGDTQPGQARSWGAL